MPSSVGAWNRDVITSDEAANKEKTSLACTSLLAQPLILRYDAYKLESWNQPNVAEASTAG